MKKGKYDEEEKALILQVGDNYPHNLSEGFRELAEKLDRDVNCISTEYYYLKKKEAQKKQGSFSFMLASKKMAVPDRKVVREGCPIKPKRIKVSLWKQILKPIIDLFK